MNVTSSRLPGSSTRARFSPKTSDNTVARAIAASGPGTLRTAAGSRGHSTRTASVSKPISSASSWWPTIWPGSARMFAIAELWAEPPSRTCSWLSTIVTPIPASMPCTIAGEIASAPRAIRLSPSRICSAPAATVMAQVTAHPKVVIV